MRLGWLELGGFRSYPAVHFEPATGVNVLMGPNAAGKSNLLEAIGYLATLRSFRGASDEAVIRLGEAAAVIRGEVHHRAGTALIEMEIPRSGRRRANVNRQRLSRAADLLGYVRIVAFLPEDLDIVKRGPAYRRDFLDGVCVQLWPGAHLDQQEYDRTLRQRNAHLRQTSSGPTDPATLDVWDRRLSQTGAKVVLRRAAAVGDIQREVSEVYGELAGEGVEVTMGYESSWVDGLDPGLGPAAAEQGLLEALGRVRRIDLERRVTTVGPHRDEPTLAIEGRDARTLASQGEQRSLALSLRLASFRAVRRVVGEEPLLLLDDVFSELDLDRARALAAALPSGQTFITTARYEEVPVEGKRWTVSPGMVV